MSHLDCPVPTSPLIQLLLSAGYSLPELLEELSTEMEPLRHFQAIEYVGTDGISRTIPAAAFLAGMGKAIPCDT